MRLFMLVIVQILIFQVFLFSLWHGLKFLFGFEVEFLNKNWKYETEHHLKAKENKFSDLKYEKHASGIETNFRLGILSTIYFST